MKKYALWIYGIVAILLLLYILLSCSPVTPMVINGREVVIEARLLEKLHHKEAMVDTAYYVMDGNIYCRVSPSLYRTVMVGDTLTCHYVSYFKP